MARIEDDLLTASQLLSEGQLGSAHKIAQTHEGDPLADTLHAIIHRREGDFSNSLYWLRRVGANFPAELADVYPDPAAFVERCRIASELDQADIDAVQTAELTALNQAIEDRRSR